MSDKDSSSDGGGSSVDPIRPITIDEVGLIHNKKEAMHLNRMLDRHGKLNELDVKRLIKTVVRYFNMQDKQEKR